MLVVGFLFAAKKGILFSEKSHESMDLIASQIQVEMSITRPFCIGVFVKPLHPNMLR